jgi:hypothetical protein
MVISEFYGVRSGTNRFGVSLRKAAVLAAALLLAVLALTFAAPGNSASAAVAIAQCNNIDNSGGLEINCEVTVVNNLNVSTGEATSTVTVKECGNAVGPLTCTTTTTSYSSLVTSVTQCNDSVNGGGAIATCSVSVTNNIIGGSTTDITPATVNQCGGTGGGGGIQPTLDCDPFPATTSGATITQCNGSTNGGGAVDRVNCTVTPSTKSALLPVLINQCNGSTNGGGSLLTCTASLTNTVVAKNVLNDAKTDGFTHQESTDRSSGLLGAGVLLLAGLLTAAFAARRTGAHR